MMKSKNNFRVVSTLLMIAASILPFFAMAQDPGGGPDTPIDGGISLLLAAGTAYGAKKYRDSKRKQEVVDK